MSKKTPVPLKYHERLKKARTLVTELRVLLEDIHSEMAQDDNVQHSLEDDTQYHSFDAANIEEWLDEDIDLI